MVLYRWLIHIYCLSLYLFFEEMASAIHILLFYERASILLGSDIETLTDILQNDTVILS